MFPVGRMRMNSIYGGSNMPQQQAEFGPPDFNGGMDIGAILPGILQALQQENDKGRDFKREMFSREQNQPQLQNIAQQVRQPIEQSKPEPKILPPTYNGMEAGDYFNLQEKKRQFDESSSLKSQQLGLKKEDTTTDNTLNRDKLNEKTNTDKSNIDIRQQRANVYDFKAKHPGMKIVIPRGGNITAVDPITGKTMDLGIDSGTLSDADKLDITGQQKLDEIDTRGFNQGENTKLQGTNRLAEIAAQGKNRQEIVNTKPGFYQGEYFRNPKDTSSDYNPERTAPAGKDVVLPAESKTSTPVIPDGRVVVYDKSGKAFHLPANQVDEAIKQGYSKDKPKGGG